MAYGSPAGRLGGKAAIVGIGEAGIGKADGRTAVELQAEAARKALDDAGLTTRDVDALFTMSGERFPTMGLVEHLRLDVRYTDSSNVGGPTSLTHVGRAAAAIATGQCSVALVTYGSTQASDRTRGPGGPPFDLKGPRGQFEVPYGLLVPLGYYAMVAQRHMHEYGTRPEQLAEIAVAARKWAQLNPAAVRREPVTIDDVLASPVISSPLHLLDCCLVTDGAGAVAVTSVERARDAAKPGIPVLGWAEAQTHNYFLTERESITTTGAAVSGPQALAMAGVELKDIDVVQVYDSFTITVLTLLEDLGFCRKGEGGAFVQGQRTAPGGPAPMNTSGGGLSYCHPGEFGMFLLLEAVRQLRGEAGARQLPEAHLALCHGAGGVLSSHTTMILGRG